MIGAATAGRLRLELISPGGKDVKGLNMEKKTRKMNRMLEEIHGLNPKNAHIHNACTVVFIGGTGGRDTAGLGGKGGPYRLDKGHDVHQLSDEEKAQVPEHIKEAARAMGREAYLERLKEIDMSEYDAKQYADFLDGVRAEVRELKVVLQSVEARGSERIWLRNQTEGDLDDAKLVDGLTGDSTIYKRRADPEPGHLGLQSKPIHFEFVMDASGSMYRFNGHDGRLQRMLEAAVMIMEAFDSLDPGRFQYSMIAHSGEGPEVFMVRPGEPPKTEAERLKVLQRLNAHAQFCLSGDHTVEATALAIERAHKIDADERFVMILSDANFDRYGIPPRMFAEALTKQPDVKTFALFIGSIGNQAAALTKALPAGRSFVCLDVSKMPKILKQIFTSVLTASAARKP